MSGAEAAARDRLIVALDLSDVEAAEAAIRQVGDAVSFYKIGYQLGFAGGLKLAERLAGEGKKVFVDFKLHDIGNTVEHGIASLARIGATFATVHAFPQTLRAAVQGRGSSDLKVLGVTVLTSWDQADLDQSGYASDVASLVERRVGQIRDLGADGVVCAATDLARVHGIAPDLLYVTPGIRPAGAEIGDQKRIATPASAIRGGATHLVVGRPILGAADPRTAAQAVVAEIAEAVATA